MKTPIRMALIALALPASAFAQGELVVYCGVQEEWCRPMVAAFEKATGIKVAMTRKSAGEVYAQLKAEAANPRADIWWGGTGDPHMQAAEEGLTEAYKSPRLAELQDWAVRQAEQSKYRTVGIYAGALGYSYNEAELKKQAQTQLDQLKADGKVDPSVTIEDKFAGPTVVGCALVAVLGTLTSDAPVLPFWPPGVVRCAK